MNRVETEIEIAAPVEDVWAVALDPNRLWEWVTIHRKLHSAPSGELKVGDTISQTLSLRGAPFRVDWNVEEYDRPKRAVWKGRGPARSTATTEYELSKTSTGTLFSYANWFDPPGGLLGRTAASALVGGLPEKEAIASLQRLKALLEQDSA